MSSESPTDHEHFSVVGIYQRRKILLDDVADSKQKKEKKKKKTKKTLTTNKQEPFSSCTPVSWYQAMK